MDDVDRQIPPWAADAGGPERPGRLGASPRDRQGPASALRILALALALTLAAAVSAAGPAAARDQRVVVRAASAAPPDSPLRGPWQAWLGRALAADRDIRIMDSPQAWHAPPTPVLLAAFARGSVDVLHVTPEQLRAWLQAPAAGNAVVLALWPEGHDRLHLTRPLTDQALSLAGRRIRVAEGDGRQARFIAALGGEAVPQPALSVAQALAAGDLDGVIWPGPGRLPAAWDDALPVRLEGDLAPAFAAVLLNLETAIGLFETGDGAVLWLGSAAATATAPAASAPGDTALTPDQRRAWRRAWAQAQ